MSWEKEEKFVLEKINEHDDAIEKQGSVNATQSQFNHDTKSRLDKIADRQTKFAMAIAALTAVVVENSEQAFKFILGLFKP